MIECSSCHTLNPDAERACLACGAALSGPAHTAAPGMARCPEGHPIDPSWRNCPYCDRLQGPQRTRLENAPSGGERRTRLEGEARPQPAPSSASFTPKPTRLELPESPQGGRRTVLQDGPPAVPSSWPAASPQDVQASTVQQAGGAGAARPLLGVLAAPALGPGGAVFPVRGGRNLIGTGRANDVVLSGDPEVSGEHAAILHRNGTFHLADRLSTNGTWLNGAEVPANGTVPLFDRDRIRCGRTELIFLVIERGEDDRAGTSSD